jgi:Core-2/I-Branching enzyme
MVRIAYLVFAYKNPQVLRKAIATLSNENCTFFIHIDQNANIAAFSGIRGQNIVFSENRVSVHWAEISGIEAIILLIRQALEGAQRYDSFVLLSGSEYPLRSSQYIHRFLDDNRGSEFMSLVKMPAPGKPLSRINTLTFPSEKPVRRFAVRALAKVGLAQRDYRKHLGGLEPYAGNTWWALSRDACEYTLEFMKRNPHVKKYFQNTFAPEESIFHTILGNSPLRPRIRRNLTYEDWCARGAHPEFINETHMRLFEAQEKVSLDDMYGSGEALFARKFSDDRLDLVDRTDEMIRRKEGYARASNK